MFSLKDPSLLAFDERCHAPQNLLTIYGIGNIPCDTTMREILDGVDPNNLRPLFKDAFHSAGGFASTWFQRIWKWTSGRIFCCNSAWIGPQLRTNDKDLHWCYCSLVAGVWGVRWRPFFNKYFLMNFFTAIPSIAEDEHTEMMRPDSRFSLSRK